MYTTSWHTRHNLPYRLKTKFRRKLKALQKKDSHIEPFSLDTNALAANWWAKAWNAHLKTYTANATNLEKGKLHFKCEALADFKIADNQVNAVVLSSKIKPYNVNITFEPVLKEKWIKIQGLYSRDFEAFERILDNDLPKEMSGLFTNKPAGILPSLKEISFTCTCTDRASVCKHTAVVLFALGAKIDNDVQLLFKLRGVSLLELISAAIHRQREVILEKVKSKHTRILKDTDLSEIFNIDLRQK